MPSHMLWDTFKLLGCSPDSIEPKDVNWMSEEPCMRLFINWFQDYITCDNVLNYGELEEFEKICATGEELHGEALDDALNRIGVPINELFVENYDLDEERDEIYDLKGQIEALSVVEEQLQASLNKQQEKELLLQKKLNDEQMTSFKDGQALMKINVSIKNGLSIFFESLQQLSSKCLNFKSADTYYFIAQAPVEEFLAQCDIFEQFTKLFIQRQFERNDLASKSNKEKLLLQLCDDYEGEEDSLSLFKHESSPGEFKIHPKTLWEAETRRVCAIAKLRGVQSATDKIESIRKTLDNQLCLGSLRLSYTRTQEECLALEKEIEILRQHEVSLAAQNFVVAKIAAIAEDFASRRSSRRRYRLDKLKALLENITKHVLLTDVLWILLRREKKLVNFASLFIDEAVTSLNQEHAKHLVVMELHQEIQEKHDAILKSLLKGSIPLADSLRRLMGIDESEDVSVLLEAIQNLFKRVEEVDQRNLIGDILTQNFILEKELKSLQESLLSGPTRRLSLIPTDVVQKMDLINNSVIELEREIGRLDSNFSSKQALFAKFPIQRDARLLWAWFLAAPAQLHAAMKRAELAVEKQQR